MKSFSPWLLLLSCSLILCSCQFNCQLGAPVAEKNKPVNKNGTLLFNGIQLSANKVEVEKAYLAFENGERVPDDNFINKDSKVKMIVFIKNGWTSENGMCRLGASEKVVADGSQILMEVDDLFGDEHLLSAEDAKIIAITAKFNLQINEPHRFAISTRIWDKSGDGVINANYELYSR